MSRKGFTLVELLVVVLIIAILAAIALPLYLSAVADSEKKTARANMQSISNGMQAYRIHDPNQAYPTVLGALVSDLGRDFSDTTNPAGPGTRYYTLTLTGAAPATCVDGNGATVTVPSDSFYVTSTVPSDGCYSPGAATN